MRAVVGRMPLWARGENADIETAMLMDRRAGGAEYRAGADETEGAEQHDKNKNPDGAD